MDTVWEQAVLHAGGDRGRSRDDEFADDVADLEPIDEEE